MSNNKLSFFDTVNTHIVQPMQLGNRRLIAPQDGLNFTLLCGFNVIAMSFAASILPWQTASMMVDYASQWLNTPAINLIMVTTLSVCLLTSRLINILATLALPIYHSTYAEMSHLAADSTLLYGTMFILLFLSYTLAAGNDLTIFNYPYLYTNLANIYMVESCMKSGINYWMIDKNMFGDQPELPERRIKQQDHWLQTIASLSTLLMVGTGMMWQWQNTTNAGYLFVLLTTLTAVSSLSLLGLKTVSERPAQAAAIQTADRYSRVEAKPTILDGFFACCRCQEPLAELTV